MKLKWDFEELYDFADNVGNVSKFESYCINLTKELAKVLHDMLFATTPVKTGNLCAGWGNSENYAYIVKRETEGFVVDLVNKEEYALYVNDGHYSYNQYNVGGRPYVVKHRTVPYTQGKSARTFVFGHFFVEKSIVQLKSSDALEKVLYKELEKWFRWCVNGK